MYKSGHVGINMLGYAPTLFILIYFNQLGLALLGLIVTVNLASLPDIDLRYWFLKHRGFTHTTVFAVLVGIVLMLCSVPMVVGAVYFGYINKFGVAFLVILGSWFIGFQTIVLHIIGDSITPTGVKPFSKPPLFPETSLFSDRKYTFDIIKAANNLGNGGFLFAGLIVIGLSFYLGMTISPHFELSISMF